MINLEKGQRVAVELPRFTIGLGWDTNTSDTGADFDLDASAFILGSNGKILADEYFVFYNNLKSPDESIKIDLSKIDPRAEEIIFVVTIHQAAERRQNFGQVRNAFIRIYDTTTGEETLRYDLDEDFSVETAVEFGRLYRRNGAWKFEAVGIPYADGLEPICRKYASRFM